MLSVKVIHIEIPELWYSDAIGEIFDVRFDEKQNQYRLIDSDRNKLLYKKYEDENIFTLKMSNLYFRNNDIIIYKNRKEKLERILND